jgi:4-hydroxy-tetrahydrodipicolinate synthase
LFGAETARMIGAYLDGDVARALALHRQLLPVYSGFFRTQGVILTKAALRLAGLPAGPVRPPLVDATAEQLEQLRRDCEDAGLTGLAPAASGMTAS